MKRRLRSLSRKLRKVSNTPTAGLLKAIGAGAAVGAYRGSAQGYSLGKSLGDHAGDIGAKVTGHDGWRSVAKKEMVAYYAPKLAISNAIAGGAVGGLLHSASRSKKPRQMLAKVGLAGLVIGGNMARNQGYAAREVKRYNEHFGRYISNNSQSPVNLATFGFLSSASRRIKRKFKGLARKKPTLVGHTLTGYNRGVKIGSAIGIAAGLARGEGLGGAAYQGIASGVRGGAIGLIAGGGIYGGRILAQKVRKKLRR